MGCNCGGARKKMQALVQQAQVSSSIPPVPPPMTRSERIRLRGLRMEARAKRIAARNAAILAAQKAAKKDLGETST
jgi:hypothetical protein